MNVSLLSSILWLQYRQTCVNIKFVSNLLLSGKLFLCINIAVSCDVIQSFRRRAVWPHCGERILHWKRCKHSDTAGLGCCVLSPQNGHCSQRSEGTVGHSSKQACYIIRLYWNNNICFIIWGLCRHHLKLLRTQCYYHKCVQFYEFPNNV